MELMGISLGDLHLTAMPVLIDYLQGLGEKDLVIVSPDTGGLKMAYGYSNLLDSGLAIVAKQRRSANEVEMNNLVGDVEGRNCVIVDDLTTTATTMMCLRKRTTRTNRSAACKESLADGVWKPGDVSSKLLFISITCFPDHA